MYQLRASLHVVCLSLLLLLSGVSSVPDSSSSGSAAAAAADSDEGQEQTPLEKSVEPFYRLTEQFLDLIQPQMRSIVLEDMANIVADSMNGSLSQSNMTLAKWRSLSLRYAIGMAGYVALICFGILFIVCLPLIGITLCCCRCCCGKCGGSLHPMESKGAKCRRLLYGLILALLATFMLCGIVLALISNQLVHDSLKGTDKSSVMGDVSSGLSETGRLLQQVGSKAALVAKPLSDSLAQRMPSVVERSTELAIDGLLKSGVEAAKELNRTVKLLDELTTQAEKLKQSRMRLQPAPANLSDKSNGRRLRALMQLDNPGLVSDKVVSAVGQLRRPVANFTGQFNQRLSLLVDKAVTEANVSLSRLSEAIVNEKLFDQLNLTAQQFGQQLIDKAASLANTEVRSPVDTRVKNITELVSEADNYRYYGFVGLTCLPLLIIVLYYLGLAYGFCGEPPFDSARCCNRGVGANMLLSGSAFAFMFSWFIMLIVLLLFVSGGVLDTELCRYLTGRAGPKGYAVLDSTASRVLKQVEYGQRLGRLSDSLFSDLLGDCEDGGAAASFDVAGNLRLIGIGDLNLLTQMLVNEVANNRAFAELNKTLNERRVRLRQLSNSAVDDLNRAISAGKNFTSDSRVIQQATQILANDPAGDSWRPLLVDVAQQTDQLVRQMRSRRVELRKLDDKFRLVVESAANLTNNDTLLLAMNQTLADSNFTDTVLEAVADVVRDQLISIFPCRQLADATNRVFGSPCRRLLRPFNGYWAGLGFFLVCLLPCLIITIKLANLYRKTNKYAKDYEEPADKSFRMRSMKAAGVKSRHRRVSRVGDRRSRRRQVAQ